MACKGSLPLGSRVQTSAAGEGRVYAFARRFVQSATDDARDVRAFPLGHDSIVDCDVAQNRTSLVLRQLVDLEEGIRHLSRAG